MASEVLITGDRHYVPDSQFPDDRIRMFTEEKSGKFVLQCTRDAGKTWKTMASEPPSDATDGWIPVLSSSGNDIKWSPPTGIASTASGSNNSVGMGWIDFLHPGELINNTTFGYFRIPNNGLKVNGIQISCFYPPQDQVIAYVQLVSQANQAITFGPRLFLAPGALFSEPLFNEVSIPEGVILTVKATVTSVNINAGSFISVRALITK